MKENDIIKERYRLLRPLGAGGFGEVWLAKDQMTGTQCAIKFYVRLDDNGRKEFCDEYKRMLGIHDAHLLTASYYDEWQGRPFLVMDYCGGGAASGKVGQLSETELWRLIRDVASGLACLHSQRDAQGKEAPVIHQDIKPANFLQKDDGTWLISDFGISSRMRSSMSSQSGREVSSGGTIPYMGPERFDRILVKASDIWSIGASIYEMATGDVPFGEFGGGAQRAGAEIPHLPKERWSPDLDRLVSSCLQKETWDRPSAELVAEYADCRISGKPLPRLPKETPPPPPNPNPKPKLWKWIAAAGAVVAVVLAIVLWPKPSIDPETQANAQTEAEKPKQSSHTQPSGSSITNTNELFKQAFWTLIHQRTISMDSYHNLFSDYKNKVEGEEYDYLRYTILKDYASFEAWTEKLQKISASELESINTIYELKSKLNQSYLRDNSQQQNVSAHTVNTTGTHAIIGTANGHEWVDLGLPSGTLWATCNVGASKPEDYGNYYAWGETRPKSIYNWRNYKYASGSSHKLTKYCNKSAYGNNGYIDDLTTLQAGDDPAASWGNSWHTPDKKQCDDLINNTTCTWTTKNGVNGLLFTAKNGQSLFLPAAGRFWSELSYVGSYGEYWSRSLCEADPSTAFLLCISPKYCKLFCVWGREGGFSVRPVLEK